MALRHLKLDLHGVCKIGFTCLDPILHTKIHQRIGSIHSKKLYNQHYMALPTCKIGFTWVTLILHGTSRPLKIRFLTTLYSIVA